MKLDRQNTALVTVKFGAHLYGTATPASDEDYKVVFLPDAPSILLQKTHATISTRRSKSTGEKNYAGEIDQEGFALHRFLGLLAEGQTMALDVLFAPRSAMMHAPAPLWTELVANRHRIISRSILRSLQYCRTQAGKYGMRGSRVHALRQIVAWFDAAIAEHGTATRLHELGSTLRQFITEQRLEHTRLFYIDQPARAAGPLLHLECCDRKVPVTNKLNDARAIYARALDQYGARALQAEQNENIDWKALSHAVRIGHQTIELLTTGAVTFPLPNAAHVLAIKTGLIPYPAVGQEIERLLEDVEAAQTTSTLPDTADMEFINQFLISAYRGVVCANCD